MSTQAAFSNFKVLTFDVVGTLIDFEAGVLAAVRKISGKTPAELSDDNIFESYKRGRDKHYERSSEVMFHVYRYLAKELGLPADDTSCDVFQLAVLRWGPFPDSVEALKRLRTKFRLVAMTNADRVALSCYEHALGNPFDDTVCADDTGVAKPNPEFFAYNKGRQSAFGYKQSDILHVAQSQYHDIAAASRLGVATCWIERRAGQHGFGATPAPGQVTEPDYRFTSLSELATAAADTGAIRFYQRCGFRLLRVVRDAFVPATGYPDDVRIDGIPLRDQVWLDRPVPPRAPA